MFLVPEGKAVVKGLRIFVGELEFPAFSAIDGFINPRLVARADAEHKGCIFVDGLDVAEVECLRAWNIHFLPALSAIHSSKDCSLGPASPCHTSRNGADATELNVSPAGLLLPLRPDRQ